MNAVTLPNTTSAFLSMQTIWDSEKLKPLKAHGQIHISRGYQWKVTCGVPQSDIEWVNANQNNLLLKPAAMLIGGELIDNPAYYHGIVTGTHVNAAQKQCQIIIEPCIAKLRYTLRSRIFENMSAMAIAKKIIDEHTKNDAQYFTMDINQCITESGLNGKKQYVMQYQESDFDFISRILHAAGIFYYFTFEEDRHIMHFVNDTSLANMHADVLSYDPHQQRKHSHIVSWNGVNQAGASSVYVDDYNPLHATNDLSAGDQDGLNYSVFPGGYQTQQQGRQLAQLLQAEKQTEQQFFEGMTGRYDVQPGTIFALNTPQDKFFVYQAVIKIEGHQHFKQRGQGEQNTLTCRFMAVPIDQPYQPTCHHQKPKIFGMQTAHVITTGETQPVEVSKMGSVKIRFSWEDVLDKADQAIPVRVMQGAAGKQWGMLWTPRQGDEVLVSFENGDIDKPIIVGSAYNSERMPAYDLECKPYTTGIKMTSINKSTADSGRSNELIFHNEIGSESVTLKAQRDLTQDIKRNKKTIVEGTSHTQINQGHMHVKVDQGAFIVKAHKNITLQVGGTKLVLKPSSMSLVAPRIKLNPSSSGSLIPSMLKLQFGKVDSVKETAHRVIQNNITADD